MMRAAADFYGQIFITGYTIWNASAIHVKQPIEHVDRCQQNIRFELVINIFFLGPHKLNILS